MVYFKTFFIAFLLCYNVDDILCSNSLEAVNDDDLLNLIRTESYVTVLFTKNNCADCELHEDVLYRIREDLVDDLNAWVVKAVNSQLVRLYNPSKEPAIVFFRHGVPLLYDGEPNDELILHTFLGNKDPCVKELNDDNFEHLTQVSTGATTGDWFVLFYTTDCVDCQYLQARWEAVCVKLKTRLNVARINRQTTGKMMGRRFGITNVPSFILFRLGKMYRYNLNVFDVPTLSKFPVEGYQKSRAELATPPKALLEDAFLGVLEVIRDCSYLLKFLSLIIAVSLVISVAYKVTNKKKSTSLKKASKTK